jgi:hypothetical protein
MVCTRCGRPLDGTGTRMRGLSDRREGARTEARDPPLLVCPWCHAVAAPDTDGERENAVGVLTRFGLVAGTRPVLAPATRRRAGTGPPHEC